MSSSRSNLALQPSSPDNTHGSRPLLRPEDVCGGCIVWLPRASYPSLICCTHCKGYVLPKACYEHPFVVLRVKQAPGSRTYGDLEVIIAMVTSFGDTSLDTYLSQQFSKSRISASYAIPILQNSESGDQAFPALMLENHRSLRKQSYVVLEHTYKAPLSALRTTGFSHDSRAFSERLSKESHSQLMALFCLQIDEGDYPPTATLAGTAKERLQKLCGPHKNLDEEIGMGSSDQTPAAEDWAQILESWRAYSQRKLPQLQTPSLSSSPSLSSARSTSNPPTPSPPQRSLTAPAPRSLAHRPYPASQSLTPPKPSLATNSHDLLQPIYEPAARGRGYETLPEPTPNSQSGSGRDSVGWRGWAVGVVVLGVVVVCVYLVARTFS